jgi:protein-L-isoaspartate(D-aspartate) O-methyltransferase
MSDMLEDFDFSSARAEMVRQDITRRGVKSPRVIEAVGRVPREKFVGPVDLDEAYADHPLGIDCGQTISQPYIVALMTEMLALSGRERVLEIGTGSGYQTAILAELAAEVFSVERHAELSARAEKTLAKLGYGNISFLVGDGTLGWAEHAPFDVIIVTAAARHVPESLKAQLADGGVLVAPVGKSGRQTLVKLTRKQNEFTEERGTDCIFVKLIGEEGYDA